VKVRIVTAASQQLGKQDITASADPNAKLLLSTETIRLLHGTKTDTTKSANSDSTASSLSVLDDTDVLIECEDIKKAFATSGVAVLYVVTKQGDNEMEDVWEAVDVVSTEQQQQQQPSSAMEEGASATES
jgi:hypothetical protein